MPSILRMSRRASFGLLGLLAVLGFVHLSADFPNHSRWIDDAAKFTDEGWWASGAIRHTLTGRWVVPGDYNPIFAVPLWPLILSLLFHFTGVSVDTARALAFTFTIGTVIAAGPLFARSRQIRSQTRIQTDALTPFFMLLVLSSPVLFFFSRLAILEPALVFFLTVAALAGYAASPPALPRSILCGVLFTCAVLMKSSAIFVAPAIYFLLWFPHRALVARPGPERLRAIRGLVVPGLTFVFLYGLYYLLVIHTHPVEIHVFYRETSPSLGLQSLRKAVRLVYRSFTWVDFIVFPATLAMLAVSWRRIPILFRNPLFGFAGLFYLGYCVFMVLHLDAEPHYFPVLAMPLMLMAVLLLDDLRQSRPAAFNIFAAILVVAAAVNIGYDLRTLARPEYTLRDSAGRVKDILLANTASAAPLVIGHGAMETSLFTHLPALDDIGSLSVAQRIALYHPGYALSWSSDTAVWSSAEMTSQYRLVPIARLPTFDSPTRDALLLWRIEPR